MQPAPPGHGVAMADTTTAAFAYKGLARSLVLDLKLRRQRPMADPLAEGMAQAIWRQGCEADVIAWVPARLSDRIDRGFDHAMVLARGLSHRMGLPTQALLARGASRPDQSRLGREARFENLKGAFVSRPAGGLRVLLVDDLITTGATAGACCAALKDQGAGSVEVIAACRA
jgi:predicted amidophosphoribosyltransferase